MTVRFSITRLQKKPRPEAGARIRHLGEDGLTGESIIRSQGLRPDNGPGSLGSGKNHLVLAPLSPLSSPFSPLFPRHFPLIPPQPCCAGSEQTQCTHRPEKMRPTPAGLRRYGSAESPVNTALCPERLKATDADKKRFFDTGSLSR